MWPHSLIFFCNQWTTVRYKFMSLFPLPIFLIVHVVTVLLVKFRSYKIGVAFQRHFVCLDIIQWKRSFHKDSKIFWSCFVNEHIISSHGCLTRNHSKFSITISKFQIDAFVISNVKSSVSFIILDSILLLLWALIVVFDAIWSFPKHGCFSSESPSKSLKQLNQWQLSSTSALQGALCLLLWPVAMWRSNAKFSWVSSNISQHFALFISPSPHFRLAYRHIALSPTAPVSPTHPVSAESAAEEWQWLVDVGQSPVARNKNPSDSNHYSSRQIGANGSVVD